MEYNQFLNSTIKTITRDEVLKIITYLSCIDNYYQTDKIIIATMIRTTISQNEQAEFILNLLSNECSEEQEMVCGIETEITEYIFQNFKVVIINII